MATFLDVDPATLHVPPSRLSGADPIKLTRQFSKHGLSVAGMPPLIGIRDRSGRVQLLDGVTRATRVAKWLPGSLVTVEIMTEYPAADYGHLPTIAETLP